MPVMPLVSAATVVVGPPWTFMAGMSSAIASYVRDVGSAS